MLKHRWFLLALGTVWVIAAIWDLIAWFATATSNCVTSYVPGNHVVTHCVARGLEAAPIVVLAILVVVPIMMALVLRHEKASSGLR